MVANEATMTVSLRSNERDILRCAYAESKDRIATYGPLVLSMHQLGQYLMTRHFVCDSNGGKSCDLALGYFLIQVSRLLRQEIVGVIAEQFTGRRRKVALAGPFYSPHVVQHDALAMLLAISAGDKATARSLHEVFTTRNVEAQANAPMPLSDLPTASLALRLLSSYIGVPGCEYIDSYQSCRTYDSIFDSSLATGAAVGRFALLCDRFICESIVQDARAAEFYECPYSIYPVAPYAVMMAKPEVVYGCSPPVSFSIGRIDHINYDAIADNVIYRTVIAGVSSSFGEFQFPYRQ